MATETNAFNIKSFINFTFYSNSIAASTFRNDNIARDSNNKSKILLKNKLYGRNADPKIRKR